MHTRPDQLCGVLACTGNVATWRVRYPETGVTVLLCDHCRYHPDRKGGTYTRLNESCTRPDESCTRPDESCTRPDEISELMKLFWSNPEID